MTEDFDYGAEMARFKAEVDQMREGVREFARTQRAYYEELLDSGFDSTQALHLTNGWLAAIFQAGKGDDAE